MQRGLAGLNNDSAAQGALPSIVKRHTHTLSRHLLTRYVNILRYVVDAAYGILLINAGSVMDHSTRKC